MGFCTQCGYKFTAPANYCPRCGSAATPTPQASEAGQDQTIPREAMAGSAAAGPSVGIGDPTIARALPSSDSLAQPSPAAVLPSAGGETVRPRLAPVFPPTQGPTHSTPGVTGVAFAPLTWPTGTPRVAAGIALLVSSCFGAWSAYHAYSTFAIAILASAIAIAASAISLVPALRQSVPTLNLGCLLGLSPLALVLSYTLVRTLVPFNGEMSGRDTPGLGMALAGSGLVILMQQLLPANPRLGRLWKRVCLGLLASSTLWGLVAVSDIFRSGFTGMFSSFLITAGLVIFAVTVLLPGWFAVQIARGRASDWAAAMILGMGLVAALFLASFTDNDYSSLGGWFTLFLWGLAAGSSPLVADQMSPPLEGASRWFQTSAGLLVLSAGGLGLSALLSLLVLREFQSAELIFTALVALAGCVGALVCRSLLARNLPMGRRYTVLWAVVTGGINLVLILTRLSELDLLSTLAPTELALALVPSLAVPLVLVGFLTLPPSVRALGPILPGATLASISTGSVPPPPPPGG